MLLKQALCSLLCLPFRIHKQIGWGLLWIGKQGLSHSKCIYVLLRCPLNGGLGLLFNWKCQCVFDVILPHEGGAARRPYRIRRLLEVAWGLRLLVFLGLLERILVRIFVHFQTSLLWLIWDLLFVFEFRSYDWCFYTRFLRVSYSRDILG